MDNQIITRAQFGFMEGKSTEDAILTLTYYTLRAFDENKYTIGIFLDLSKAFDTVDHSIMLHKLEYYGVRNESKEWFSSYLSHRQQFVCYNGHISSLTPITYGVPQGSILGPLLFLIYINDIVNSSEIFKFILFADDSNLYVSHSDIHALIDITNVELEKVRQWIISNKLTINVGKTHYLIFHRRRLPHEVEHIVLGGEILERSQNTKFLGVIIEDSLKWDKHIQLIISKISKLCGILYLTRYTLTTKALKTIYYSLVYPNLTYCLTVWGASGISKLGPLIVAQKRVIRAVSFLSRFESTNNAFLNLKILKFTDISSYCSATYVYKKINCDVENSYFSFRSNNHYDFRNASLLELPLVRSSQSQKFIDFNGVKIWNSLPAYIRCKPSISTFKSALKIYLLSHYIPD